MINKRYLYCFTKYFIVYFSLLQDFWSRQGWSTKSVRNIHNASKHGRNQKSNVASFGKNSAWGYFLCWQKLIPILNGNFHIEMIANLDDEKFLSNSKSCLQDCVLLVEKWFFSKGVLLLLTFDINKKHLVGDKYKPSYNIF